MKRGVPVLAVAMLTLAEPLPRPALGGLIGFNFAANRNDDQASPIAAGEYDALAAADVAGAPGFEQAHWNNLLSDWSGLGGAVPSPLLGSDGAPAPSLAIAYDAPNTWDTGIAMTTPDDRLMRNYLDSNPGAPGHPYLVIQDIPFPRFTVIVYADGDATDGRTAEYWIDDAAPTPSELTPHLWRTDRSNFGGSYVRISSGATSEARAEDGNYIVFTGLTSSAIRVRANGPVRSPLSAVQIVAADETVWWMPATLALTPPSGATNRLDIRIHAQGSVQADLGWPLGVVNIPINAADSDASTLSGSLVLDLPLTFDPATQQAVPLGIEFAGGRVQTDQALSWTLDLGSYFFVDLGDILLSGQNLAGYLNTPDPPGSLAAGVFPQSEHNLVLNEGVIAGYATGLAADFMDPVNVDLAQTPLDAASGGGQGALLISPPSIDGILATYTVEVTAPMNFSDVVMDTPVVTTASATGVLKARGTFARMLPDFDGDRIYDGADPDDDNDLLPDAYEEQNGLDPRNAADAARDPDGDGLSTLEEYIAGTDPGDGLSFFLITAVSAEQAPSLRFAAVPGRRYRIATRENAASDWTTLSWEMSGTGEEAVFTDDGAHAFRAYRVVVDME